MFEPAEGASSQFISAIVRTEGSLATVLDFERLFAPDAAAAFGLGEGQLTVLIHSGSRGLGHQVCSDYVKRMDGAMRRYGIELPDRQLACAPISSPEGQAYLAAMAAAANFAWANRQAIANRVRDAVRRVLGAPSCDRQDFHIPARFG